jgi:hypothetical protein
LPPTSISTRSFVVLDDEKKLGEPVDRREALCLGDAVGAAEAVCDGTEEGKTAREREEERENTVTGISSEGTVWMLDNKRVAKKSVENHAWNWEAPAPSLPLPSLPPFLSPSLPPSLPLSLPLSTLAYRR